MASLAAESARTLPRILQWPGIHWKWVRVIVFLMERQRISRSGEEPSGAIQRDCIDCVDWLRFCLTQPTACPSSFPRRSMSVLRLDPSRCQRHPELQGRRW